MMLAGRNDIFRPEHIDTVVVLVCAPDSRLGRDMKDNVAAFRSAEDVVGSRQIPRPLLHAEGSQVRVSGSGKATHPGAALQEFAHNRTAEKSAAAGDEGFHRACCAAQRASFSRNILALCRISTGKAG